MRTAIFSVTYLCLIGLLVSCGATKPASQVSSVRPSLTSMGVWNQVKSDSYTSLPQTKVSLWGFASSRWNPSPDLIAKRAVETVADDENLLPYFKKLVHPNGICLKGEWVITEDSEYTGAYAKGTKLAFIGRASSAFSETTRGQYRAFGLAGKVFSDPESSSAYKTANFFTIDDLAGTKTEDFTAVTLSNEPPLTAKNMLKQGPTVMAIGAATAAAFALADSNPGVRQLYQLSELGTDSNKLVVTPKWMHLKAASKFKAKYADFRQDLNISNFAGPLEFDISVSSFDQEHMRKIGKIVIRESVTSESCDHRLHFNHPVWRDDLNH